MTNEFKHPERPETGQATTSPTQQAESPETDSVAKIKADLNRLMAQHGNPTFEALSVRSKSFSPRVREIYRLTRSAEYSAGTMENIVLPDRPLPSLDAVKVFVLALTKDLVLAEEYVSRCSDVTGSPRNVEPEPADPVLPGRKEPLSSRPRFIAAAAAVLVATNALTAGVMWLALHESPASADTQLVKTGDDPNRPECTDSARIAASRVPDAEQNFKIEIVYSQACNAFWGKITRNDNSGMGNKVIVDIYRQDDPGGPTRQHAEEADVQSAYTTLIVRDSPVDRLCVVGSVTTGPTVQATPTPLCI